MLFFLLTGKWKLASKAAVVTVNGSVGGGLWVISYCYLLTTRFRKKLNITELTNGILAGLVSMTAICAICQPWDALIIGWIGGMISSYGGNRYVFILREHICIFKIGDKIIYFLC